MAFGGKQLKQAKTGQIWPDPEFPFKNHSNTREMLYRKVMNNQLDPHGKLAERSEISPLGVKFHTFD